MTGTLRNPGNVAAGMEGGGPLLTPADGQPFEVIKPEGASPVLLICEHAANLVPAQLSDLGLSEEQLTSHVAWDPGAYDLALALSASLDAPLVAARFSRLAYDCNRPPEVISAMPFETEAFPVPGNTSLSQQQKDARAVEIYEPFHGAVSGVKALQELRGQDTVVVSVHSFTPVFHGKQRFVEIGYLCNENDRLARAMLARKHSEQVHDIRLNEPYGPADGVLHTINLHTDGGRDPHLMIEVRNDLLSNADGIREIHDLLSDALQSSLNEISQTDNLDALK